jgi:hypothetical protein
LRGTQSGPAVRRPGAIRAAAGLLSLMAVAGLAYGVVVLASLNGLIERFRSGVTGSAAGPAEIDSAIGLLRFGAVINTVVTVVVTVVLVVLALGLLHGGAVTRVVTWVVCGLGLVCGWTSVGVLIVQRSLPLRLVGAGQQPAADLLRALTVAYPDWWTGLAGGLAAAQALSYLLVAVLLALPSAGAFYRRMAIPPGPPPPVGPPPAEPSGFPRVEQSVPPPD